MNFEYDLTLIKKAYKSVKFFSSVSPVGKLPLNWLEDSLLQPMTIYGPNDYIDHEQISATKKLDNALQSSQVY